MARRYAVGIWYLELELTSIEGFIEATDDADQLYALGLERAALREALDYLLSAS